VDETEQEGDSELIFNSVDIAEEVQKWGQMIITQRMKASRREALLKWGARYVLEENEGGTKVSVKTNVNKGSSQWEIGAKAFWDSGKHSEKASSETESEDEQTRQSRQRPSKRTIAARFKIDAKRLKQSKDAGKLIKSIVYLKFW
jgi:hypothetical protein